jgi:hypothetical protein
MVGLPSDVDELKVLDLLPSYEDSALEERDVPIRVHDELPGLGIELNGSGEVEILGLGIAGGVGAVSVGVRIGARRAGHPVES